VGECNYYLKARFPNDKEAVIGQARLTALLAEGERAYEWWQSQRGGSQPEPSADEFWAYFRAAFPLTTGYLGPLAEIEDWSNGLAGMLGCLVDPSDGQAARLEREGDLLSLKLRRIWHFTEMHLLEAYLEECGAVAVGSVSEEWLEWQEEDDDLDEEAIDERCFDAIEM
jgi:hypothetical protein